MAVLPRYGYLWIVALCLLASPARQASAVPTRRLPLEHATTVRSTATNQPRTACSFYLWNSPSALLRKWCRHLMKDCVYEGRGGVKFVRIEPGSVLQLLYPCSRYSADSCAFCGGTFPDHMALSWAKNLYTPFDRYLDRVREEGIVLPLTKGSKPSKKKSAVAVAPAAPQHVFHRRYVYDSETSPKASLQHKEKHLHRKLYEVTYRIPFTELTILRAAVLTAVEGLIRWEALDNQTARQRLEMDDSCC